MGVQEEYRCGIHMKLGYDEVEDFLQGHPEIQARTYYHIDCVQCCKVFEAVSRLLFSMLTGGDVLTGA